MNPAAWAWPSPLCGLVDMPRGVDVGERPGLADDHVQVAPLDIFHDDVMRVAFVVDVVGLDDVRMVQRRNRAGLAMKPLQVRRRGVLDAPLGKHLDGHAAMHQEVFGKVDAAHATGPQVPEQLVFADEKTLVPAFQQLVGLPARQQLGFDQVRGQPGGIVRLPRFGLPLQPADEQVEPVWIDQPAPPRQVEEYLSGWLGHKMGCCVRERSRLNPQIAKRRQDGAKDREHRTLNLGF